MHSWKQMRNQISLFSLFKSFVSYVILLPHHLSPMDGWPSEPGWDLTAEPTSFGLFREKFHKGGLFRPTTVKRHSPTREWSRLLSEVNSKHPSFNKKIKMPKKSIFLSATVSSSLKRKQDLFPALCRFQLFFQSYFINMFYCYNNTLHSNMLIHCSLQIAC